MFNNDISKKFKLTYFISSFLLSYLFLLIIMYVQNWEATGKLRFILLPFWTKSFWTKSFWKVTSGITKEIAFTLLLLFAIASFCSLLYVRRKISQSLEYIESERKKVILGTTFNKGSREFILSVLLPVVTTISVPETPITGIIALLLIQLILGYFFWHSNEIFPNVSLMLFGYSLINAQLGKQELLLFIKNHKLRSSIGKEVRFINLDPCSDREINIGIVGDNDG